MWNIYRHLQNVTEEIVGYFSIHIKLYVKQACMAKWQQNDIYLSGDKTFYGIR